MAGRKRKNKRTTKRVEFVLSSNNQRDLVVWDYLDRLTRSGEAGEFIKQTLYVSIEHPEPETQPATPDDIQALKDEILTLQFMVRNIKSVKSTAQEDEPEQDQERVKDISKKLLGLSFGNLEFTDETND